jgi:dihydrofolate reductase
MADLIYTAILSLDGYIEGPSGRFDWAAPSDEVHQFVNNLIRPAGTHLYGRRMYETMQVWETDPGLAAHSPIYADFAAIWQAADKVVYSTTLSEVATARTRLERRFDPEAVRRLKAEADRDLAIGGPGLAAHAFRAGLVDRLHLLLVPILVGGGKPGLPADVLLRLELVDERRFAGGMVFLDYRAMPAVAS